MKEPFKLPIKLKRRPRRYWPFDGQDEQVYELVGWDLPGLSA